MINFLTFFKNHLDTNKISNANFQRFAESHLQRIIANNPNGRYDNNISNLKIALDSFNEAVAEEDQSFNYQRILTKRTDDLIASFKSSVSQKEGIVRGTWSIDSEPYMEFFPNGLTEYANAIKGNMLKLMHRMADAATKYQADLNPKFVSLFNDIYEKYQVVRSEQLNSIGDVAGDKTNLHKVRHKLSLVLTHNLLTVASYHIEDPDRGMDYFDQTIVRTANSAVEDEGETISKDVLPITTEVVIENIDIDNTLVIQNTGTVPLTFSASEEPTATGSNSLTVSPGNRVTERIRQITPDAEDGWYFVATNPNSDTLGSFSIERLP